MKKILLVLCAFVSGACGASSSGAASSSDSESGLVEEIKGIYLMKSCPFDETLQRQVDVYAKAPFMEGLTSDDVMTILEKNHPECPKSQLELAHVYYELYRYSDYHKMSDANKYFKQYEKWISLAVEQEYPEAMYCLGARIIDRNEKKGIALIQAAVQKNYPPALLFQAHLRQYGLFISKNQTEAVYNYQLAANMGLKTAWEVLDVLYSYGKCGVPQNEDESKKCILMYETQIETCTTRYEREIYDKILCKLRYLAQGDKKYQKAFYAPSIAVYFKEIYKAQTKYWMARLLSKHESEYAQIHLEELSDILAKGKSRKHNVAFNIIQRAPSVTYEKYHHHAVIGLCPGNQRHFTSEYIANLMQRAQRTFDKVTFFIPTGWSIHNYKARGRNKSARKATIDADKVIIERLKEAFGLCGIPNNPVPKSLWTVVLGADLVQDAESKTEVYIENDPVYQAAYAECLRKYKANEIVTGTEKIGDETVPYEEGYKDLCRAVTAKYMHLEGNETAINEAVHYLLREMPLFEASSAIFRVPSSYNVYHDIPEFLKLIPKKAKQGFVKVDPPEDRASTGSSSGTSSSSSSCGD